MALTGLATWHRAARGVHRLPNRGGGFTLTGTLLVMVMVVTCFGIRAAYADITTGLVAYYPFNGNAQNEAGSGNHGTVHGATLAPDREGQANSAYRFDGDDWIEASADGLPTAQRTVSLWFNADDVSLRPCVLGYAGGGCGGVWFMCINHAGQASFHMSSHCGANAIDYFYTLPPQDAWYHFAITTDADGTRLYVNSVLQASNSTFVSDTPVSGTDLAIGVIVGTDGQGPYTDGNVNFFTGEIDDVRIYDRALTAEEIGDLFHLACGNLVVDVGEQCDDGNGVDGDGCDSNCTLTGCGNGIVTDGEQCDDGNQSAEDCCSAACQGEVGLPCPDEGDPCTLDTCDATGTCNHSAGADGVPCDDGDALCTSDDQCIAGGCVGTSICSLEGSWQATFDCGGGVIAAYSRRITLAEPSGAPSFTERPLCGTIYRDGGIMGFDDCTTLGTVVGGAAGSTIRFPATGTYFTTATFNPPDPSFCPATAVRLELDSHEDLTVTDRTGVMATRLSGTISHDAMRFYDPDDNLCWTIPIQCSAIFRRNEVPAQPDVTTTPLDGASITFANVDVPGTVNVIQYSNPVATVPSNFQLADQPVFFDVVTTAAVSGPITVCLPYPDADNDGYVDGTTPPLDETLLLLLHEEDGEFINRTVSRDPVANQICAETTHLSQFVFGVATSSCGNGVVEPGEACDLGAGLNGGPSCCTAACQLRGPGEICRPARDVCDVADACDGASAECLDSVNTNQGGTPCQDDGNPCTIDACDGMGACRHLGGNDGVTCDDRDVCTVHDSCSSGVCQGADPVCGDGIVEGCECDDGTANGTAGSCCTATCGFNALGASCDESGNLCTADVCNGAGACIRGGSPATACKLSSVPQASSLELRNLAADNRDMVAWEWTKGAETTFSELGNPDETDDYAFCLYDESTSTPSLVYSAHIPAGGLCSGKPCWVQKGAPTAPTGWRYTNREAADGVQRLQLKAGTEARSRAMLKGDGGNLDLPAFTSLPLPLKAQLRSTSGACFETNFSESNVVRNESGFFKARAD